MKRWILVFLLTGCAPSGYAVEMSEALERRTRFVDHDADLPGDLTVESVEDAVVRRNPDLVAALERWVAFLERVPGREPAVASPMAGYRYAPMLKMDEVEAGVSVPFPTKVAADAETALAEARGARADFEERENQLRAQARGAYARLWLAEQELALVTSNAALLDRFIEIAEVKFRAGTATLPDVLRAKVERDGLDAERASLERTRTAARASLSVLLDRPPLAPLGALAPPPSPVPSGELARLLDEGVGRRPLLQGALSRVAAAESARERATQDWFPDLTLSGGADYDFATHGTFPEASVGLSLPIFPGSISAHVRETDALLRSARADARAARNRVLEEIAESAMRADAAAERWRIFATTAVPRALEAIRAAEAAYVAKEIDFLALVDAQRQLLARELDRERALADYTVARGELERALGRR